MMDIANMILTEPVSMPTPLENLTKILPGEKTKRTSENDNIEELKMKQAAKDFESVLINKLLDAMQETIGQLGLEKDAASKQIQSIFGMYLSRHIANNGGFGLWKDIYKSLTNTPDTNIPTDSLDNNI